MSKDCNYWYHEFWAQNWYKNTFLVHDPVDIARAIRGDKEWNNIHDSGCHFTCLAMIIGLDPARLASELSSNEEADYFCEDTDIKAIDLGSNRTNLVWDQNKPNTKAKPIKLKNIWLTSSKDSKPIRARGDVTLKYIGFTKTKKYDKAVDTVKRIEKEGHHIICGPSDHSILIAGEKGDDYFLWDPDISCDEVGNVQKAMNGSYTLRQLFEDNKSQGAIEFWEYKLEIEEK